jgi:hypothetical protein
MFHGTYITAAAAAAAAATSVIITLFVRERRKALASMRVEMTVVSSGSVVCAPCSR